MKLSIIIPVYRTQDTLERCLESILQQSFTDYEMILVDDGSDDGSPQLCDEYARKDARIRVIHKENGGLSDARNAGIRKARGEYITFVDSDRSSPLLLFWAIWPTFQYSRQKTQIKWDYMPCYMAKAAAISPARWYRPAAR